ncbi:MAG: hypothetical protein NTV56_01845 [Alphaproteobacteria bacterium]|nr:hypothetical protein [Alphaproteobacteria bacterium]
MPFRNAQEFDQQTLANMRRAFDDVMLMIDLKEGDPKSSRLATIIITLASSGERDVTALRDRALREMSS